MPGGYWAIAITSGCNFGYATGRISMDQAQDAATSACESVLSVKCRVIESGHNVCDDDKRLKSMSDWAFASANYGEFYAAAIGWWCGRAYGRFGWDEVQVNYLAANDCNRDARREDDDLRAMSPCGIAAKGVAECSDERTWAQAAKDAKASTERGNAWAVIASKQCDIYTVTDLGSVEEAEDTGVFADCLDAARAEGLGDRGCGVVASGKVA
ncbi:hypothetical protein HYH03_008429 [Edaphochlamys debaryana]|uniref:DUF4189 domain-containing protein n=1 Tax=Edaphochlamys debaryana TaxID=47281 RepID=A0A835XZT5_9CHLO|nr:hypothetical protein HYH03_008429 [Edaphochlamys debaryana]|eukprot:KAG2493293.1 hypothetical protein HYH03_008429 [Edaphochlamys debaryana]